MRVLITGAGGFLGRGLASALAERPGEISRLVLTDIALPGMTGFNLAAALRSDERTRHVPIIGLTAHWAPEVHATAASVAMHTVLLKPCVPSHLVAELERLLAHAKGAA